MKICNKKDFLRLPVGTLFCKGIPFVFDSLCIKDQSLENDFSYINLCMFESDGSHDLADKELQSFDKGLSYPMNSHIGRDGCFNDGDIFLVFEQEDLMVLHNHIIRALFTILNKDSTLTNKSESDTEC